MKTVIIEGIYITSDPQGIDKEALLKLLNLKASFSLEGIKFHYDLKITFQVENDVTLFHLQTHPIFNRVLDVAMPLFCRFVGSCRFEGETQFIAMSSFNRDVIIADLVTDFLIESKIAPQAYKFCRANIKREFTEEIAKLYTKILSNHSELPRIIG